jgi:hypothetical protein
MVHPTHRLAPMSGLLGSITDVLNAIFGEFGYSAAALANVGTIAGGFADRAWFPVPIRARCTLTTEGSMYRMTSSPLTRGW